MQAQRHKAVWLRMLAIKEIRFKRDTQKMLKLQAKQIAKAYSKGGQADAELLIDSAEPTWGRVLVANYAAIIRDFSSYLLAQLTDKNKKANFTDLVQSFITREAVRKAKGLTKTTKEDLTRVLARAQSQGIATEAVARQISKDMSALSVGRAATIARTETAMAANYAMFATANEVEFKKNKVWVAVEDDRTRETHSFVDGTELEMDDYFDVGNDRLLYPGDSSGSPEEVINCRCTLIYVPVGNIFSEAEYE